MSTQDNKEIVRRFILGPLQGRNLDLIDEVLAPNYKNFMTGTDPAALKGMLTGISTALSNIRFEIDDLIVKGMRWWLDGRWRQPTPVLLWERYPRERRFRRAA
jgi:hypothetical protein